MAVLDSTDVNLVWNKDVDPGTTSQTAGGALWTLMARTNATTNTQLPSVLSKLDDVLTLLNTINTKLDNMNTLPAADIAYIKSAVDTITADPSVEGHDHPIVAAVEWADNN